MWFAHAQTANGIARRAAFGDCFRRGHTQVLVRRALHNGEQMLVESVLRRCGVQMRDAAIQPPVRAFHRFPGIAVIAGIRGALVEGHDDVRPDAALDVHGSLRAEQVLAAIDVAAERHALFGDLAAVGQAEHLVAAAVGQNRSLPIHEFVQPARRLQHVGAGAEVQMVSIAQDDLRADVVAQIPLRHRFDRSCRSNRHENRRLDDPVVRCDAAGTCLGLRVFAVDLKVERCHGAW